RGISPPVSSCPRSVSTPIAGECKRAREPGKKPRLANELASAGLADVARHHLPALHRVGHLDLVADLEGPVEARRQDEDLAVRQSQLMLRGADGLDRADIGRRRECCGGENRGGEGRGDEGFAHCASPHWSCLATRATASWPEGPV